MAEKKKGPDVREVAAATAAIGRSAEAAFDEQAPAPAAPTVQRFDNARENQPIKTRAAGSPSPSVKGTVENLKAIPGNLKAIPGNLKSSAKEAVGGIKKLLGR
jgi:hypothetical protein